MGAGSEDRVRRFMLEEMPVRGHWVHVGASWVALLEHANYPPAVRSLLGEALAAAVLMAASLKFDGTLTLQLSGNGVVRLLVAQCTHDFRIRGVARFDETALTTDFHALVGDGTLAVTVETEDNASRYQGVVPLAGASLAHALEEYFERSEQIPSRVLLAADSGSIGGLLLQRVALEGGKQLDMAESAVDASWDRIREAFAALEPLAVLRAPVEEAVRAALPSADIRLFSGSAVRFECRCNPERVAGLLRALGEQETRDVLREQGAVTVTCEFCQRPYVFDSIDVEKLFAAAQMAPGSDRVN
jgi:molecular chaperone Hsp33